MTEYSPGQQIVLERNPDWNKDGRPYVDKYTLQFGLEPTVGVLRVQKNEADTLGEIFPPAKYLEVSQDPSLKDRFVTSGQLNTNYMTMNFNIKPLDDLRVRRAINMAVNKQRLVQVLNNRGTVTGQVLPPAMAGYDPNYQGYPYVRRRPRRCWPKPVSATASRPSSTSRASIPGRAWRSRSSRISPP